MALIGFFLNGLWNLCTEKWSRVGSVSTHKLCNVSSVRGVIRVVIACFHLLGNFWQTSFSFSHFLKNLRQDFFQIRENKNNIFTQLRYSFWIFTVYRFVFQWDLSIYHWKAYKKLLHDNHNQTVAAWHSKWAASWQNQQNDLCTQRSAWASTQSDQSLCSVLCW